MRVEFKGSVSFSIAYESYWSQDVNLSLTLKYCLFGTVKLTKNDDPDKCSYSGYGIDFDSCSLFSFPTFDWSKNLVIFGVNNISLFHIDNKKARYLSPWYSSNTIVDNTIATKAEAEYKVR